MTWTCRDCEAIIRGYRAEHCPLCHETFTGTQPGDMHMRTQRDRNANPDLPKCLTPDEMEAKGMTRNRHGHWTTGQRFESAAEQFAGKNSSV